MTTHIYSYDLPETLVFDGDVAIDTEAMGLEHHRDRLCMVQLSDGKGNAYLVHFPTPRYEAPRLRALLSDRSRTFIFHYARFDVAILYHSFGIMVSPLFCTKIASRLCRTYTDSHGLRDLCKDLLSVNLAKTHGSTDWGNEKISNEQRDYAANDVLHLHALRKKLQTMLVRENRTELAASCFDFIPTRVTLDLKGWPNCDIFAH